MHLQWVKFLRREAVRKSREVLWINIDESSIPIVSTNTRGNMKKMSRRIAWRFAAKIKSKQSDLRGSFTFIGMVCNIPEIQPYLPQIILVGEKYISWADMEWLWARAPSNVYIRRKPGKGWTNEGEHKVIIDILGRVLEPWKNVYQPVLVFDALKAHLTDAVLDELFFAQMWYLVIPKEMTGTLQPLDTHCFGSLKKYLRERFNDDLGRSSHDKKLTSMVSYLIDAIPTTMNGRSWLQAFEDNGFGANQRIEIAERIKHQLEWTEDFPRITACKPTELQLRTACWPSDVNFNAVAAFLPFPRTHQTEALAIAAPPTPPVLALPAAAAAAADDDEVSSTRPESVAGEASYVDAVMETSTQNLVDVTTAPLAPSTAQQMQLALTPRPPSSSNSLLIAALAKGPAKAPSVAKPKALGPMILPPSDQMSSLPTGVLRSLKAGDGIAGGDVSEDDA